MLRPDTTVFCTGASDDQAAHLAHSAILDTTTMTWAPGPDFPPGDDAGDTSAVLLPSGQWKPTAPMLTLSAVAGLVSDGEAPLSIRITSIAGTWNVDDVYVDPHQRW